jgi:hypothetical protein
MDALRSFFLTLIGCGLIWTLANQWIKRYQFLIALFLLVILDLWLVDKRYINQDTFISRSLHKEKDVQDLRMADQVIYNYETEGRGYYRVLDLSDPVFSSANASYYHNSIGGYHAAKLRRYQDLIDRHLQAAIDRVTRLFDGRTNRGEIWENLAKEPVLNMLNTEYIISQGESTPVRNIHTLGNSWFIDSVIMVGSSVDEINALEGINTASVAVVHDEFRNYFQSTHFYKIGQIQLTDYKPDKLSYESTASFEQLAVFSEIWYGPNKGWQAYIDNIPVPHIRVNYLLRGLLVPAGRHEITFRFEPKSFATGTAITWILSLVILLSLLGYILYFGTRYFFLTYQNLEGEKMKAKVKQQKKASQKKRKNGKKK